MVRFSNIYSSQNYLKWLALITSLIIGVGSIMYTNRLVAEIRTSEKHQIDLYARTLEYLANENDSRNLLFIMDEIVEANTTIPVILTDENEHPEYFLNLPKAEEMEEEERGTYLRETIANMKLVHAPLVVNLLDDQNNAYGKKFIFYENSSLLIRLKYYPYVQLLVIALFVLVTFVIFNYSRSSEQNRVWVGLAKETAHQLGTPLSSLIAWTEYLKAKYPDDGNIGELDKDIARLEMITARFSSIGSLPKLVPENIYREVREGVSYLQSRLSSKIEIELKSENQQMAVLLNKELFSWILENLFKNAADAMNGVGKITVHIFSQDDKKCIMDISDTGKGISAKNVTKIFKPGYTSKQRGWGLGLTLVKRIVENYHGGKIFVKFSESGKGTTFRLIFQRP